MRVLPIVLASAAGLALAGISDDPIECLSGCSGKTLSDNASISGKKCTAATECVDVSAVSAAVLTPCGQDLLITALDACILSICPRPFANIDLVQKLRRNGSAPCFLPCRREC